MSTAPMVGLEPSCLAVLRHDALGLLGGTTRRPWPWPGRGDPGRGAGGRAGVDPPDLSGVAVVAQPHCHQHAVLGWEADRPAGPGRGEVTAVGGCCGLAGSFGAERGHYDVSVAVAETALLSRPCRPPARTRSSWPTGSPAGPSSTTWPAAGPSTWPSSSTRPDTDPGGHPGPGPLGAELLVEEVVLLGPEVEAEAEAHGAALEGVGGGVLEAGAVVGPVVDVADVADLLDPDLAAVDRAGEPPDAADDDVLEGGGAGLGRRLRALGSGATAATSPRITWTSSKSKGRRCSAGAG